MAIDPADPTAPQPRGWWTQLIDSLESRLLRPRPRLMLWAMLVTGVLVLAGGWVFVASTDEGERRINRPKAPQISGRVVDVFADGNPVGWVERGIPWVEPALEWLAAYPLIPLVILFFWLISWGGLARGLGLPNLIWPDGWWQRWWVGVAVSLLFANLLFVRYMLEFRSGIQVDYGQTLSLFWFEPTVSEGYKVGQFLFCTLIPCLVLFYVPKMFSKIYWRLASLDRIPGPLFLGLVWGVLIILGLWYLDSSRDVSKQLGQWLRDDVGLRGLKAVPLAWAEMHGRATVMTAIPILALIVFLIESRYGGVWSPVWSVALLIALFSSLYGFIAYHLAGLQLILLLGLLAIAWVCNRSQPYKMSHPGLESYNPLVNPVLLDAEPAGRPHLMPAITARELLTTFHGKWTSKTGTNNTKPKMVVVAC
ncbi:MAG TPA: hypothetical protein VG122_05500, partial [Gemmata sp.]|nr:hypothetical protein [Gemmata sp.]